MEHFEEVLNRPAPAERPDIPKAAKPLKIKSGRPTKTEIKTAIKQLKSGKAAGPDNIPPEALKAEPNLTTDLLYSFFGRIWEEERTPTEWTEGYIVKLLKKGDRSNCNNYRGITLLSVPSKIFNRVILKSSPGCRGQEASGPASRIQERSLMYRPHSNTTHHN